MRADLHKSAPSCIAYFSSKALLDRVGHFRDGHQGPRDLIQQLVRIFFLRQRLREERYNGAVAQLLCEIFCGRVAGNLVVFDPLCRANKCEVGESVLLVRSLIHD